MISGLNNSLYSGPDLHPARNPASGPKAPAVRPDGESRAPVTVQNPDSASSTDALPEVDSQAYARRVQARAAAEDVRLEVFHPDTVSLNSQRALQTFAEVAAGGADEFQGRDVELAGVDIRV